MTHQNDIPLTHKDIQTLSSADRLAAFFTRLRYPAEARLPMTAEALQLPEKLADAVQRIELLTQVDDGVSVLQVYLFELTSVTVARTRALTRVFRDRSGNFLLVLTDDYTRLDFVLLEREIPGLPGEGITTKAVSVVPRTLSVDRHDPGRVALRVLRRFTFTEFDRDGDPDTLAQYHKLKSAFAIAEWSQPYFNNRALFSDYYLTERLPETEAWNAPERNRAFRAVRALFAEARAQRTVKAQSIAQEALIQPLLETLGFTVEAGDEADFLLHAEDTGEPCAFVLAYPWNRYLDGKDTARDPLRGESNPGAQVVGLLEAGMAPWGVVTNGKLWRLYSAKAHSRATNYYEIDLEETLATPDPAEAFRYFYLFFRAEAYGRGRETSPTMPGSEADTFLDALLEESNTYARELGDRLKDKVFERVFPHFAKGFIHGMGGAEALLALSKEERDSRLQTVFNGTLTFLYRLLFLLYAESRDLLPVREARGYYPLSLQRLKEEIAEAAGPLEDQAPENLKAAYGATSTTLYERLLQLFNVIDQGSARHNVPAYNGGLFLTDPDSDKKDLESEAARFLNRAKLPDRSLALGLDLMARDVDSKRGDLGLIDYKSLGVRQLGSIYEGLLEFKLRVAVERMAVVKGKRTEQVLPYAEAVEADQTILTEGRGKSARARTYPPGTVYLENDRRERKATGSYYTPDYIVKYIVRQTVGPVMDEKLAALRPRLRQVERDFHRLIKRKKEMEKVVPDEPRLLQNTFGDTLHALFAIKILDPAMGSGHFLVEAVDYVTDRLVRFLDGFPFLATFFEGMRRAILEEMNRQRVTVHPDRLTDVTLLKRHVLKRCIYGVDLNPMAVELAKVSLWLDCFTLGAPLSFLDHHLRPGNSLIGAMAQELDEGDGDGPQMTLFTGPFTGLLRAAEIMRGVSRLTDVTLEQVQESDSLFKAYDAAAKPFKQLLDIHVAQHFGVERAAEFLTSHSQDEALAMLKGQADVPEIYADVLTQARALYEEKGLFHWDLEFPEVFIDLENTKWNDDGGFDAVIGNPPYVRGRVLPSAEKEFFGRKYDKLYKSYDLYVVFVELALRILNTNGFHAFIIPYSLLNQSYGEMLRKYLLKSFLLRQIVDLSNQRVFEDATVVNCVPVISKSSNERQCGKNNIEVYVPTSKQNFIMTSKTVEQLVLLNLPQSMIRLDLTDNKLSITEKMELQSVPFDDLAYVSYSVAAHSEIENKKKEAYIFSHKATEKCVPFVEAWEIERFSINNTGRFLHYDPNIVRRPGLPELFSTDKLMFRDVVGKYGFIVALDSDGLYADYSVICATLKHKIQNVKRTGITLSQKEENFISSYGILFLTAIFNSQLANFYFKSLLDCDLHVYPENIRAIPIRRIHFTTPESERECLTDELIALYERGEGEALLARVESLLPKDKNGEFLAFQENATGAEEKSDVVHDLLAHLAEQMIAMNKTKQARVESFWDDLESVTALDDFDELRNRGKWEQSLGKDAVCLPYVDPESRSTKHIDESLGWDEDCFRAFAGMLIGKSSLTPKMTAVYREHHSACKALVARIASTDALIDEVVYRLYGLTEEEIQVVEGE